MPKALIAEMKRGYGGSNLSEEEINHRVYGALNKMGAMHGNKETPKGETMENKYESDHKAKAQKGAFGAMLKKRGGR